MGKIKQTLVGATAALAVSVGTLAVAMPADAAEKGWSKNFGSYSDCQWATSKKLQELRGKRVVVFHRCKWSTHPNNRNTWSTALNYWT